MPSIRETNPYLKKKTRAQVRDMIRRTAYESSVFEGVKLPKNHPSAVLSKASRKIAAKAS
jgi:hypothetical protein